ncbi:MAG: hypothetical protein IKE41_03685 [Clostridia bacterium]|nr:hypothetical protein [Clostridia bacterium]
MKAVDFSIVVMKYENPNGTVDFKCIDDESLPNIEKIKEMFENKNLYEADGCKILWIKTFSNSMVSRNY